MFVTIVANWYANGISDSKSSRELYLFTTFYKHKTLLLVC